MITDSDGNRLTVTGWTDGAEQAIGIQRLGVGQVLRLEPDAARKLATELLRKAHLVRRAAAELAPDEPELPAVYPHAGNRGVLRTGRSFTPARRGARRVQPGGRG